MYRVVTYRPFLVRFSPEKLLWISIEMNKTEPLWDMKIPNIFSFLWFKVRLSFFLAIFRVE